MATPNTQSSAGDRGEIRYFDDGCDERQSGFNDSRMDAEAVLIEDQLKTDVEQEFLKSLEASLSHEIGFISPLRLCREDLMKETTYKMIRTKAI